MKYFNQTVNTLFKEINGYFSKIEINKQAATNRISKPIVQGGIIILRTEGVAELKKK